MFHGSQIELSRSALRQNLDFIRSTLNPETRLVSVIKGNAYGHGIGRMTGMLQAEGVNYFAVFNAEEAWQVKPLLKDDDQLIIMGQVEDDALEWAIENGVEVFAFDLARIEKAAKYAQKLGKKALLHLEAETGMYRTGLDSKTLQKAADLLSQNPDSLTFQGLCTHFAGAESITNYHRVRGQIRRYRQIAKEFTRQKILPKYQHTCCSAGILRHPKMHLDLARVGILQYGHWPSQETRFEHIIKKKTLDDPLRRVLAWRSRVMTIKEVKMGKFIGYGTSFQAPYNMRIAIIPVGYGYGYSRNLSNQGYVIIRGKRAPVVGTINMNALTADITEIPEAAPKDQVTLIGISGKEEITVSSFGEMSRQLNYELLTRLPALIPRNIVD